MQVILTATKGPGSGTVISVRRGQVVQVGRTAWADFSVPGDDAMSDIHFALQYDARGCRVRDLNSAAGTFVNEVKVTESPLRSGDRLAAGLTEFSVLVEGEPAAEPGASEDADTAEMPVEPTAGTASDLCQHIELDEDAKSLLEETQSPEEFLTALIAAERFRDAIKFLAIWLPKPIAVAWAGQCVREVFGESLPDSEQQALEAALQWAGDPIEEHRRAAGEAGEAAGFGSAPGLLGMAAFVSGGSLAPPDLPPVPPAEGLTAQCIAGALAMAAYHGDPSQAGQRHRGFLETGRKLATTGAGAPPTGTEDSS